MSLTKFLHDQISDLVSPNERISGNRPILADEGLALTLRYFATGKPFQFLSYQFLIFLVSITSWKVVVPSMIGYKTHLSNFSTLTKSGLKFPENLSNVGIHRCPRCNRWKHLQIIKLNNWGSYFMQTHIFNQTFSNSQSGIWTSLHRCWF